MKDSSIKTKLLFITGIMIFLVVLGLILNSLIKQNKTFKNSLLREIKANGEILKVIIEPLLDFNNKDNIEIILKKIVDNSKSIKGFSIYDVERHKEWLSFLSVKSNDFMSFSIKKDKKIIGRLKIFYTMDEIKKEINSILIGNVIIGVLIFLFAILFLSILFERIKKRLKLLINISNKIAQGDLAGSKEILLKTLWVFKERENKSLIDDESVFKKFRGKRKIGGRDELNLVLMENYFMVKNLSHLISRIKRTENTVTESAEEISTGAREIEASSIEQSATTNEITVTNEEVGATSKELYSNIKKIGEEIKKTVVLANTGKNSLLKMEEAMNRLIQSTRSISSKLAVINSKTNKISGVSTTINTISDQTNLLSVNAAIEAEKAGEYGKGFLVIAKEINHLANRTGSATHEIENMISEMQSSVLSGVMEMDKFSGDVKKRVDEIDDIGGNLTEIINQVQDLEPEFELIRDGMNAQNTSTIQISESMVQLATSTRQTKNSIIEFKTVTDSLKETVTRLRDELTKFKL